MSLVCFRSAGQLSILAEKQRRRVEAAQTDGANGTTNGAAPPQHSPAALEKAKLSSMVRALKRKAGGEQEKEKEVKQNEEVARRKRGKGKR